MPEQQSTNALPLTASSFQSPFQTEIYPAGMGGLNLKDQHDAIPVGQWAKHTNLTHSVDRGVTVRNGLSSYATGGTKHHSVRRLADPQNSTYTRFWGIDQSLYLGQSGALASIDSGYSGDPLVLLPHRPPLSGDPWMFVADRSRMRKVRFDGLTIPIGLPAPATAPGLSLAAEQYTPIAGFDPGFFGDDGSRATLWTPNQGYLFDEDTGVLTTHQSGVPTMVDNGEFTAQPGEAATVPNSGWYSFWGIAAALDLSKVGTKDASDQDIVQLDLIFAQPWALAEFRLYVVVSPNFDATQLPGQSGQLSTDFYVKIFKPAELNPLSLASPETTAIATRFADLNNQQQQAVKDYATAKGYGTTPAGINRAFLETEDPTRSLAIDAYAVSAFKYFGTLGIPLRRGDWKRYGTTAGCDWSTVTGLVMYYQLKDHVTGPTQFGILNWKITGGAGPDTMEPGAQPYDYRVTHYDPRTGAEGNPSPTMDTVNFIDSLRRGINVLPPAYGNAAIRQRVYRRGGSLTDDWYFAGTNASDGGDFLDEETDDGIVTAGTVNLDHYEPVPTVNDAGDTVTAQPVPVLFGPVQGLLFALGDPYRPGHLYWSIPDEPDHWPAESNVEVCSPSEELMAGLRYGAQAFCFSRERLYAIYPNLASDLEVVVTTTACRRGLVSRWAWAVGKGGIYGVAKDGIFVTAGGAEEIITLDIQPLFRGQTWNGYPPVDFTVPLLLRLAVYQDQLIFHYQGTDGAQHTLVYSILFKFWSAWTFAPGTTFLLPDDDTATTMLFVGGRTTGTTYLYDPAAYSDVGTAIACTLESADWDLGRAREDKLLGDQIVDADPQGVELTLQNFLNNQAVTNDPQVFATATGRQRYIFDSFGTIPQRARNITSRLSWSSASARPTVYFLGQSFILEPDVTINRVTQWDDLGASDEFYSTGVTFDCDTGNQARTIIIESDYNGLINTVATLSVQTDGRHKVKFSWAAIQAHKVRIRPNDDCKAWILYAADWIKLPEPPRISKWDIHYEADGDQYYTGLDLFCDTGNLEKQIVVTVDGATLVNPYTSEAFWRITANGREWLHLTFLAGRGHVFHFHAVDDNPGLLYKHKWFVVPEPSEQANFNQGYSTHGTLADKYFKAFLFEVDTFGQTKSVTVEIDGTVVETLSVNTNGRKVQQIALSQRRLGRVLRVYPSDGNPGRPYQITPLFDIEPYQLDRWETEELDFDLPGFKVLLDWHLGIKSTADVTLTVSTYVNQLGTIVTDTYTIPSTAGVKDSRYLAFLPRKGVLFRFVFTSAAAFYLYEEESVLQIQPWGAPTPILWRGIGNDDLDRSRNMMSADLAASRPGGGA